MDQNTEIFVTADGSHSLLNKALNETYHSVHGALQESIYVFIEMGLKILPTHQKKSIKILEVGFGTGLNALLSLRFSQSHVDFQFEYTSLEAFPIGEETWRQLNYGAAIGMEEEFSSLHRSSWESPQLLANNFTLTKREMKIQDGFIGKNAFDIVFFDAFAPSKQPEMWELSVLEKVADSLLPGGVFVTYCAKGQLKRDLRSLGFRVETLPGPPGKKEMVRGVLEQHVSHT